MKPIALPLSGSTAALFHGRLLAPMASETELSGHSGKIRVNAVHVGNVLIILIKPLPRNEVVESGFSPHPNIALTGVGITRQHSLPPYTSS